MRSSLTFLSLALIVCACECSDEPPPAIGNAGIGEECARVGDCRRGLICDPDTDSCQPAGTTGEGAACELTGDCTEDLYCNQLRVCAMAGVEPEGSDCDSTSECERGLICVIEGFGGRCRATGEADLGDMCATDSDCVAGLSCIGRTGGESVCESAPPIAPLDGGVTPPPIPPFWAGEECDPMGEEGTNEALFRIPRDGTDFDFYSLPYPNDIRRTATGLDLTGHPSPATALPIDIIGRYLRASETDLDGFGVNPTIFFRFSAAYDWDSMADRFLVVDVTPGSPTYGERQNLAWFFSFGRVSKYVCENWFALRTGAGRPLQPGRTYAALLRTGITTNADSPATMTRSGDLDAVLGTSMPSDSAVQGAWDAYTPLRDWLADPMNMEITSAEVLNAALFTTSNPERVITGLRDVIRARPEPTVTDITLCDGTATSPCDDGTMQRTCGAVSPDFHEVHGRIELPIFQQGTAPYEEPEDGGGIDVDGDGVPVLARTEEVCFALTVPKTAPPPEGFPLVIVGHGTGGSFTGPARNGLGAAVATGDHGGMPVAAATLAIDLPQHGERRGGSMRDPDRLFFNFANPRAARDNITQGSADLFSLVYFAESYAVDMASSPTGEAIAFDPTRITMYMHSQGATHASLMLPYEPSVAAIVLSGNGGDLTQSLLNKTEPIDIAGILPFALLDIGDDGSLPTGSFHPALAIFQAYFDQVDPVNFGRRLTADPIMGAPGRHVFMTYGLGDSFSPEATMRAYSVSARLRLVRPLLGESWGLAEEDPPVMGNIMVDMAPFTMGLRQYDPSAAGVDGHFVALQTPEGLADVSAFLLGALAGDVPTIGN